jgi:hypothetical protein
VRPPRLQLLELEDQEWFPAVLRDLATDYLRFVEGKVGMAVPLAETLGQFLDATGERRVLDLGSGGGGVWSEVLGIFAASGRRVEVTLSDRYPNLNAWSALALRSGGSIRFLRQPVDARKLPAGQGPAGQGVPAGQGGLRTLCNAFHHFAPNDARRVLANLAADGQPIAVFEIVRRTWSSVIAMLGLPLVVWLVTPLIRPFRWIRLLWTYVVPLVPLVVVWDGVVSHLRAYTAAELVELASEAVPDYVWSIESTAIGRTPLELTALLGHPRRAAVGPRPEERDSEERDMVASESIA